MAGSFYADGLEEICIGNQNEPVSFPGSARQFYGLIDEVRISAGRRYTSDFTPEEALESDEDTLALWKFEEGSGTTVYDSGPDGYDGTLIAGDFTTDSPAASDPLESLVCTIDTDSSDADDDAISYTITWEVDGVAYTDATTTDETGDTVPAADIGELETWTCTATPNDGDDDGDAAVASITTDGCAADGLSEDCPGQDCLQISKMVYLWETANIGLTPMETAWMPMKRIVGWTHPMAAGLDLGDGLQ